MIKKIKFEKPSIMAVGDLEKLTGQNGKNNDDGMKTQWSKLASNVRINL
ncbi:hypothetical protein SAMN05444392_102303 [Seinonella peptonophila]|uniref:Uncharacterized protein n=1 Tax=Seinonella peptonophila TaxID=112248 RepID=A0A1M4VDE6_9BACL|nr:hypothetical protein [Seinonella peptonophila]SHE66898.1 hypothetical protein SAMN05444392_102303 [Seinonella peptonophila]